MSSHRLLGLGAAALLVGVAALTGISSPASQAAAAYGTLSIVQAVPDSTYDVAVDGQDHGEAPVGRVLGPFRLTEGEHTVRFDPGSGQPMSATVQVHSGGSSDLVIHLPAQTGGDPIADVYRTPDRPLAPDMARVLVAHTATVPPADVRVDGKTVFENIANGEYAVADVPAGDHKAALVPAGTTAEPLLGPLDVDLPAGTITLVYAVGSPRNSSMDVISHQESVPTEKASAPQQIRTGSAGLIERPVSVFGVG